MDSGVGLPTPRGSGTSGHVQASKFLAKPRPAYSTAAAGNACGTRKPNKDILEHDRKRQVELRLLELREALEEQGYAEAEIEERVAEARKAAEIEAEGATEEGIPPLPNEGSMGTQSHYAAARKEKQLENMRAAFELDTDEMQRKGIPKAM